MSWHNQYISQSFVSAPFYPINLTPILQQGGPVYNGTPGAVLGGITGVRHNVMVVSDPSRAGTSQTFCTQTYQPSPQQTNYHSLNLPHYGSQQVARPNSHYGSQQVARANPPQTSATVVSVNVSHSHQNTYKEITTWSDGTTEIWFGAMTEGRFCKMTLHKSR